MPTQVRALAVHEHRHQDRLGATRRHRPAAALAEVEQAAGDRDDVVLERGELVELERVQRVAEQVAPVHLLEQRLQVVAAGRVHEPEEPVAVHVGLARLALREVVEDRGGVTAVGREPCAGTARGSRCRPLGRTLLAAVGRLETRPRHPADGDLGTPPPSAASRPDLGTRPTETLEHRRRRPPRDPTPAPGRRRPWNTAAVGRLETRPRHPADGDLGCRDVSGRRDGSAPHRGRRASTPSGPSAWPCTSRGRRRAAARPT